MLACYKPAKLLTQRQQLSAPCDQRSSGMQNLSAGSAASDVTFLNEVILLLVPRKLDPHGDDKGGKVPTIEKDVSEHA